MPAAGGTDGGDAANFRSLFLNRDADNDRLRREHHYADNYVATSKYTLARLDKARNARNRTS